MIRFLKVSRQYPDGRGVADITFTIDRGEFVLLEGPIGAGKTTILRLIYLDLQPSSGQVMLEEEFGHKLGGGKRSALRRRMGIVFPEPRLLPDRSLFENVALPLRIAGESHRNIHRRVSHSLFRFGLQSRARARPAELSSGEQKKASIARALVHRPFILLADEPLANIDADAGAEILQHLRQIHLEGTTILAATHRSEPYKSIASRILALQEGRLINSPTALPV